MPNPNAASLASRSTSFEAGNCQPRRGWLQGFESFLACIAGGLSDQGMRQINNKNQISDIFFAFVINRCLDNLY